MLTVTQKEFWFVTGSQHLYGEDVINVVREDSEEIVKGLNDSNIKGIYYIQLFVNLMWSIIFFILKWRFFAFIWIILLDILVILMIIKFYKKNKFSGLLQIPYLLWILFASYLNLAIYLLNG